MTSPTPTPVTLFICRTCGYKQAVKIAREAGLTEEQAQFQAGNPLSQQLARQTEQILARDHPAHAAHITIKLTGCLSVCDQGIAWGLRAEDRFAYTFAHAPADLTTGPADLATAALAYLTTRPGAKISKDKLPPSIRPHVLSKLPPV